ncbi:MAG TPA: hypothetical protein VJZ68_09065 [Nitrososphaera sp.]|nr:hypothetical protein [Nitrososphaera sp.]
MAESKNIWKYSTFGLLAVLAIGFSFPQASAHVTNSTMHMLQEIYNFVDGIEAKTNNLPSDPASETSVNTRASQTSVGNLQSTADAIMAKTDTIPSDPATNTAISSAQSSINSNTDAESDEIQENVGLTKSYADAGVINAPDGTTVAETVFLFGPGKTSSGHISGIVNLHSGETFSAFCRVGEPADSRSVELFGADATGSYELNQDFSCHALILASTDTSDGNDALGVEYWITAQYVETTNVGP